jgi:hypothetical protein
MGIKESGSGVDFIIMFSSIFNVVTGDRKGCPYNTKSSPKAALHLYYM